MVPRQETRTREVRYTTFKPTTETKQVEYTVMVPQTETKQATRQVCRMVPETRTRTVCEDQGHWEEQTAQPGCGDCGCRSQRTCRVWVPNQVTREVEYTVMRRQLED